MFVKKIKQHLLLSVLLFSLSPSAFAAEITVSAASSLTNAFQQIAQHYQTAHPETKVLLNFAASGVLQQQIARGAPVDIFASADEKTMNLAIAEGHIDNESHRPFAKNQLVVITPFKAQTSLTQLTDLQKPEIQRIAVGNPDSVPVGQYTKVSLAEAGLWEALQEKVIHTQNVRHSLDYVARNEVDAGFVYNTDAALQPDKVAVAFTVPTPVDIIYPIAITSHSNNPTEAARFIDYLLSPAGQAVMSSYGFIAP